MAFETVIIPIKRKSRVLHKAQFGCLSDIYSINITRGCSFRCVYCYARAYPNAPAAGEVYLYENIAQQVARELDSPRRRSPVDWVVFNTASDSFQAHPTILKIAYKTMEALLERGVGISFLTKGWIPDRFLELFKNYPRLVSASIGLVSLSGCYKEAFEPGAAQPTDRLKNIERLSAIGINASVRIDPIIPFLTDTEAEMGHLMRELRTRGVKKVVLSYLHLRPAIINQLAREISSTQFKLLSSCFETQPWIRVGTSTKSKLVPLAFRNKGYERFKAISKQLGMVAVVCGCKNPDMPARICTERKTGARGRDEEGRQLSLFQC